MQAVSTAGILDKQPGDPELAGRETLWVTQCVPSSTFKSISCYSLVATRSPHLEGLLSAALPMGLLPRQPASMRALPGEEAQTDPAGRT